MSFQGAGASRPVRFFDRYATPRLLDIGEPHSSPRRLELTFFNPWEEIRHTSNHLPHWQQPGATYFVTYRMADAIPQLLHDELAAERAIWLKLHPLPWTEKIEREYHERFSGTIERWLDAGHGSCALRNPARAQMVAGALGFFEAERYVQHAWTVMPNHVHALFSLAPAWALEKVLHSWKSFTAHEFAKQPGLSQPFWQEDYFDRLVRDERHFANCVSYIRNNPRKARLREGEYLLYEGEMAKRVE